MELSTENLDIQAGLEADVVVHPVQGNPNQEFHVEVSLEPAEKVQIVGIYKGDDGNFHVKFIPVVPGTYDIFIDGEKLVDSHFTVQAKERQMDVISKLELKGEIPKQPIGIAVNSQGLIAVADIHKHCIFIFGEKGDFLRTLGCYGKKPGQLSSPVGVTFLNDDEILVADALNHRVQQFNVKIGRCKDFAPKWSRVSFEYEICVFATSAFGVRPRSHRRQIFGISCITDVCPKTCPRQLERCIFRVALDE